MNGVTRGARLWAIREHEPVPVIVLDHAADGWWVAFDNTDDGKGRNVVESRTARHLYPSRKEAGAK